MINTLLLPELHEMLASGDAEGLHEFCSAMHPANTADFMAGLSPSETWQVLQHTDAPSRTELFHYFERPKQVEMVEQLDRAQIAELISELASDERVDIIKEAKPEIVAELLPLLPIDDRRDIQRLISYAEGTAGAVMTTDFARIGERLTVREALDEIARQAEHLETIYYLYVVDEDDHLRGVVSGRQLIAAMVRPETPVSDLMERSVEAVLVDDDQEEVARKVAKYDLLAIPVVDRRRHLVGIVTHDDVLDFVREEAIEDAQKAGAMAPLQASYLETPIVTLAIKRGVWLTVLFLGGTLTTLAMRNYDSPRNLWPWLGIFLPLIIASGGNMGSQSATLIITSMTAGHLTPRDWLLVVRRELISGVLLGGFLATIGYIIAFALLSYEASTDPATTIGHPAFAALVIPATLILVAICGALCGALLPLGFRRLGLDPALMSNPFVSSLVDILGIMIYMNVALLLLQRIWN